MKHNPIQINRNTYDHIASHFARTTAWMDADFIARAKHFIQQLPPQTTLLDLGCGPGRDLSWFTQQGIDAIGADLSYGMLKEAQQAGISNLCQMEMRHLPFADHSFSGVWCNAALIHIPKGDIPTTLAEIRRVLLPGGRFCVSIQQGSGEKIERHSLLGNRRFLARYALEEMREYITQAGFVVCSQEAYEFRRKWLWFECEVGA
ncbi:MAG: class I SAM-dependent methyltransferase [Anaerolineaceae bacterium]|nr:class I SAM-dependent methyltransferase [Anaerolineaceae bacterium]